MKQIKILPILLAAVFSLAALVAMLGVLGAAPVLAQDQSGTDPMSSDRLYQPPPPDDDDFDFTIVFTDPPFILITDLSGIIVGEGTHEGEARCSGGICSQSTQLTISCCLTDTWYIEYNYSILRSVNLEEESVVMEGMGTINRSGQSKRFSFTATFRNISDGKIYARYDASLPEASVILPSAPGIFELSETGGS